ncbi:hypothetical protein M9H77_14232 [Catharanthus roseus]|uniref:Uncharacterized protein n=1 Tax=Catharanthus roseus TaxID=4058 RepID=A0ACC0BMM3_CATRO|nr:hypothetical protein M9H77_14232 [Catharanthus roseus]
MGEGRGFTDLFSPSFFSFSSPVLPHWNPVMHWASTETDRRLVLSLGCPFELSFGWLLLGPPLDRVFCWLASGPPPDRVLRKIPAAWAGHPGRLLFCVALFYSLFSKPKPKPGLDQRESKYLPILPHWNPVMHWASTKTDRLLVLSLGCPFGLSFGWLLLGPPLDRVFCWLASGPPPDRVLCEIPAAWAGHPGRLLVTRARSFGWPFLLMASPWFYTQSHSICSHCRFIILVSFGVFKTPAFLLLLPVGSAIAVLSVYGVQQPCLQSPLFICCRKCRNSSRSGNDGTTLPGTPFPTGLPTVLRADQHLTNTQKWK